ncbi:MAG TPA: tagaturonate reductase [Candidatus Sphingobacterium stercoripullorum]|nr:tagaturonate reductase [Candidatus Sphingobacterium stercoripullorum]
MKRLLSISRLNKLNAEGVQIPLEETLSYPEKVLQFGTGVLLRGLPDYFINKANQQGVFKGRVVVVKSTSRGGVDDFTSQDCLYTLCVQGIENKKQVENYIVNSSLSRVLIAKEQWEEILQVARSEDLEVIISNTTEAGIVKVSETIGDESPDSFPAKLLAVLLARFKHFGGDLSKGVVILPTELINDNGQTLKKIVLELAKENQLSEDFINWLENANYFSNTLVDRIVPGALPAEKHEEITGRLGYDDNLMIMAEPYRLWAIEAPNEKVKSKLSFAQVDPGVKLVESIEKYKEIKLRLLNGAHTLSCAAALLCGFKTVKEALGDDDFRRFVENTLFNEIGSCLIGKVGIQKQDVQEFGSSVIDRFSNPYLDHKWESIALNYTAKLKMRNVDILDQWYEHSSSAPVFFSYGFAAYLHLYRARKENGEWVSDVKVGRVTLQDELAEEVNGYTSSEGDPVASILKDESLWGRDLTKLPGLLKEVTKAWKSIQENGALETIKSLNASSN